MELVTRRGRVTVARAWHVRDVVTTVDTFVEAWWHEGRLPAEADAPIVLKPNLNNDLVALTGNSTDPRVLGALLKALRVRGYRDLTVADGSNVGVHRRGISAIRRLRIDALAELHGARVVDLNEDDGEPVLLRAGARPRVARTVRDAALLIGVPTLKTHAEAGLSCALKNQVGVCVGQDKREMHRDLAANLHALALQVRPHLYVVDALVGMEGNGPGDGDPVRLDALLAGDDPWLVDVVAAHLVGIAPTDVSYLRHALADGTLDAALLAEVASRVTPLKRVTPAPPRSLLARLADAPLLAPLKRAVRPVTDRPEVAALAYRAGVLQDVYERDDDTLRVVGRDGSSCGTCLNCASVCPTGLSREDIGVKTGLPDCTQCLLCAWACPQDAIRLEGDLNAMQRPWTRYHASIAAICSAPVTPQE